jgi:two-component system chemotaxis response regulator CheB
MLWEIEDGDLLRFRCRIGHAYSEDSLVAEQIETLEEAFWVALRALEESAALSHQLAQRAADRGRIQSAIHFRDQAHSAEERAKLIRNVLINGVLRITSASRHADDVSDNLAITDDNES